MRYGLSCITHTPPQKKKEKKRYVEALTPSTSKCNLVWNRAFIEVIEKNKVIRVGPHPERLVFSHKKKCGHRDSDGGCHGEIRLRCVVGDGLVMPDTAS